LSLTENQQERGAQCTIIPIEPLSRQYQVLRAKAQILTKTPKWIWPFCVKNIHPTAERAEHCDVMGALTHTGAIAFRLISQTVIGFAFLTNMLILVSMQLRNHPCMSSNGKSNLASAMDMDVRRG